MRHRPLATVAAVALASALVSASAAAQDSNFALSDAQKPAPIAGWTFTPSMLFQESWDDNVLLRSRADEAPRDVLSLLNPRADVNFLGRRGQFSADYDGAFLFYRRLGTLNSYDQHATVSARRLITRHVALFVTDSAVAVPTTELVQFIAVPFIRTGSRLDSLRTGIEAALTKYTSLKASYDFEWVQFGHDAPFAQFLRGGHSHGATIELRHALRTNTTLLADYDVRHAIVVGRGVFDVQNANAGVEHKLSSDTRLFAAVGIARLGVTDFGPARTGPAVRAGLSHQYQKASFDLAYNRSYVPAFGFGGTYQNEEVAAFLRLPLSQRIYTSSSVSWRRNEPLTSGDLRLKSIWVEGILGFALQPWVRLEAFYSGSHQTIDQPGGERGRSRVGIQIVTAKPLRVR